MLIPARQRGWDTLANGALLSAAEEAAVDSLLTTGRKDPLPVQANQDLGHSFACECAAKAELDLKWRNAGVAGGAHQLSIQTGQRQSFADG